MNHFMYPATLATFLRERSGMGELAITNTLRNSGREGWPWDIITTNGNYRVWPVPGGFRVRPSKLNIPI